MGSWNETCALTGLPILEDDEVYVIKVQNRTQKYLLPCSPAFLGTYDDYGSVVWSTPTPLFYKNLQGVVVADLDDPAFDSILDVENPSAVFFLKEETDGIIDYFVKKEGFANENLSSYEQFKSYLEDEFTKELPRDTDTDTVPSYVTEDKKADWLRLQQYSKVEHEILVPITECLFLPYGFTRFLLTVYNEHPERWETTLESTYILLVLTEIFQTLNKSWNPALKGSQHSISSLHSVVALAVLRAVEREASEYDEEYDVDLSEQGVLSSPAMTAYYNAVKGLMVEEAVKDE